MSWNLIAVEIVRTQIHFLSDVFRRRRLCGNLNSLINRDLT